MALEDVVRALLAGDPYGPRERKNAYESKHERDKKYHSGEVDKRLKALFDRPKKKKKKKVGLESNIGRH